MMEVDIEAEEELLKSDGESDGKCAPPSTMSFSEALCSGSPTRNVADTPKQDSDIPVTRPPSRSSDSGVARPPLRSSDSGVARPPRSSNVLNFGVSGSRAAQRQRSKAARNVNASTSSAGNSDQLSLSTGGDTTSSVRPHSSSSEPVLSKKQLKRRQWIARLRERKANWIAMKRKSVNLAAPLQTESGAKRNRSIDQATPVSHAAKKQCIKNTPDKKIDSGEEKLKVAYVAESNDAGISDESGLLLRKHLLIEVDKALLSGNVIPQFRGMALKFGMLRVTCANDATLAWLSDISRSIPELWPNSKICLLSKEDIDLTKVSVFVALDYSSEEIESADTVLQRIGRQNPSISIKKWKVFHREEKHGKGQLLVLGVDKQTVSALVSLEGKLFYRFRQIYFTGLPKGVVKTPNVDIPEA